MNKRGGPPVKVILIAASLLGCVYLLYIYNASQSRLREAEASAERYRRSDESKVAQLQDTVKEKDILQEKCENDRQEFVNRLNSLNSQHKMLKSQHDELEAENGRIQQDLQKVRDDNANIEAQRSQEFNQMKQEKELEIASLRDQLANMQRQNDQLQNEISGLKSQLENAQKQLIVDQSTIRSLEQTTEKQKKQHLMDQGSVRNLEKQLLAQKQNAAAAANVVNQLQQGQQQNLQQQPQQPQQQLLQQQQNQAQLNPQGGVQPNDLLYQGQGQGQGQVLGNAGIQNMNQDVNQNVNNIIQAQNEQHQIAPANLDQQPAALAAQQGQQADVHQGQVEINNAQHQMAAPNMEGAPQAGVNQDDHDDAHPDMEHNDGQIFKPDFNVNNMGMDDRDDNRHEFDDNRDVLDKKHLVDTFHDGDDHDNRMQNEGPVNLQVQEPPNRNLDESNHIPQQIVAAAPRDDGQDGPNDIQPLQPQGLGQDQILVPNMGLGKRKDDGVQVEGEGRKEAPMPHADM